MDKGKHAVAGLLGHPGRLVVKMNRRLPVEYEEGEPGGSANYWVEPQVAALFEKANKSITGGFSL